VAGCEVGISSAASKTMKHRNVQRFAIAHHH
jgi:hypothetical protein